MQNKTLVFVVMTAPIAVYCIRGVRPRLLSYTAHHELAADYQRENHEKNNEKKPSTSTTQETLRDSLSDIDAWSQQVSNEIAKESFRFRIRRIEMEVLPELDRIEKQLIADTTTSFGDFDSRHQVVNKVRRRWQDELSAFKEQLSKLP